MPSIRTIKELVREYLNQQKDVRSILLSKNQRVSIDFGLLEVQAMIYEFITEVEGNKMVDPELYFDKIPERGYALKDNELVMPFLYFLCHSYPQFPVLHKSIDGFLKLHRPILYFQDIAKTSSGVTRVKTNLRFAFHIARKLGLVIDYNIGLSPDPRPSEPSLMFLKLLCEKLHTGSLDINSLIDLPNNFYSELNLERTIKGKLNLDLTAVPVQRGSVKILGNRLVENLPYDAGDFILEAYDKFVYDKHRYIATPVREYKLGLSQSLLKAAGMRRKDFL